MTLLERLEAATGPDRELNAEIAVAIKLGVPEIQPKDDLIYNSKRHPGDHCSPGTYWRHSRSGKSLHTAPAYTTSIDAAMTLVDDDMVSDILNDALEYAGQRGWLEGHYKQGLILAICIAAIKARDEG